MLGALVQLVLFAVHAAATAEAPEQGPSVAVNVGHVSIVPLKAEQVYGKTHPNVPFQTH